MPDERNEDNLTPIEGPATCLNCAHWREQFYDYPRGTGRCGAIHSSGSDRYDETNHAYMVTFGKPTDELAFMTEEWFSCSLHQHINRWWDSDA